MQVQYKKAGFEPRKQELSQRIKLNLNKFKKISVYVYNKQINNKYNYWIPSNLISLNNFH